MLEDDCESFGHLVTWVSTSSMVCKCSPHSVPGYPPDLSGPLYELQRLRVWALADKLNIFALFQIALTKHKQCLEQLGLSLSSNAVEFACKHTAEDSALRKHLVGEALVAIFTKEMYFLV
jgi:hypothetical protein